MNKSNPTIYIEPEEELTSIIERLSKNRAKEITIVVPKRAQLFQSIVNLKLLKKEAEKLEKKISIVTSDKFGQSLVAKANLSLGQEPEEREIPAEKEKESETVMRPAGEQEIDDRPRRIIRVSDIIRPSAQKPFEEEIKEQAPVQKEEYPKIKPPQQTKRKKPAIFLSSFSTKFFLIFIIFSLIIAALVAFLVLPTSNIIITPRTEPLSADLKIIADGAISQSDLETNKVPAERIYTEEEETREFSATGEKEVQEKATGVITVYNQWSSQDQALRPTTRFLSKEGKLFKTTEWVVVPGAAIKEGQLVAGSIEVRVEADQPGTEYNIEPTSFRLPAFQEYGQMDKYNKIWGESKQAMSGGATGKVKVVSEQDVAQAMEGLLTDLRQRAEDRLRDNIPEGMKLIDEAIKEDVFGGNPSVSPGQPGDKFKMTLKVTREALVFDEQAVIDLINSNLESKISQDKKLLPETQKISYQEVSLKPDLNQLVLEIYVEQMAVFKIDSEKLMNQLAGKTEAEIKELITQWPEIDAIKINFWPFWVNKVPLSTEKVNILTTVPTLE